MEIALDYHKDRSSYGKKRTFFYIVTFSIKRRSNRQFFGQ